MSRPRLDKAPAREAPDSSAIKNGRLMHMPEYV